MQRASYNIKRNVRHVQARSPSERTVHGRGRMGHSRKMSQTSWGDLDPPIAARRELEEDIPKCQGSLSNGRTTV